jgi:mono/diheme cytochrome c family protein
VTPPRTDRGSEAMHSFTRLYLVLPLFVLIVFFQRGTAQTPPEEMVSTSTGVYTSEQATRGEETYMSICVTCHPAGTYTTPLFRNTWNGRPLADLFALVSDTMPKHEPASLTPKAYAQVVAYLLQINEAPAGKVELAADADALKKIRIEMPVDKK